MTAYENKWALKGSLKSMIRLWRPKVLKEEKMLFFIWNFCRCLLLSLNNEKKKSIFFILIIFVRHISSLNMNYPFYLSLLAPSVSRILLFAFFFLSFSLQSLSLSFFSSFFFTQTHSNHSKSYFLFFFSFVFFTPKHFYFETFFKGNKHEESWPKKNPSLKLLSPPYRSFLLGGIFILQAEINYIGRAI